MSDVILKAAGKNFEGWENITVNRSIEAMSGRFNITVSGNEIADITPGIECVLKYGEKPLISGYVDEISISLSGDEHEVTMSGRDKTEDLVDCSATNEAQEFTGIGFDELIGKLIKPFGIKYINEAGKQEPFEKFSLQQETVFEAIERACRLRGVLPTSTPEGELIIQKYGVKRADTSLVLGKNVLSASVSHSHIERFSEYRVYGQQPGSDTVDGDTAAGSYGRATDNRIKRFRPLIVVAEGAADAGIAKKRAQWEASVRAARSLSVDVTVQGWEQTEDGRLWCMNEIVSCVLPTIGVNGDMLIKEISFSKSDNGTTTFLRLTRKDAYQKKPEVEKDDQDL